MCSSQSIPYQTNPNKFNANFFYFYLVYITPSLLIGIVRCYLAMLEQEEKAAEPSNDKISQDQVAIRRKTAKKVEKKQIDKKNEKEKNGKKKDFDHDGSLAAVTASEKGYLKCAFEYCEDLKKFDVLQNDYESALLRFDVSEKMGKVGNMLTSLLDCHRMRPTEWSTLANVVRLMNATTSENSTIAALVSEQLEKILASMGSSTVEECVSTFVARGMEVQGVGRLRARLNVAELLCVAKLPTSSWEKDAVNALENCIETKQETELIGRETAAAVRSAERALELLSTLNGGNVEQFKTSAGKRFVLSSVFGAVAPVIVEVNGLLSTATEEEKLKMNNVEKETKEK